MVEGEHERYSRYISCIIYILIIILNVLIGVYGVIHISEERYNILFVTYSIISVFLMVVVPGVCCVCIPWLKSRKKTDEEYTIMYYNDSE